MRNLALKSALACTFAVTALVATSAFAMTCVCKAVGGGVYVCICKAEV